MRIARSIRAGLGVLAVTSTLVGLAGAAVASASDAQQVEIRDDCDPATFNAALGQGACVGNGDTTLNDLVAQLQKDQTAGAWRFSPDHAGIHPGTPLVVVNRGGELHTFNCVRQFGGGIVDFLNQLTGNTSLAVPCSGAALVPVFVPAGGRLPPMTLAPGIYKFQCFIHPWMRTMITVGND